MQCAFCLYAQSLSAKERHVYISPYDSNLYYAVRSFYYFAITSPYNISLALNDQTHLETILIALLHR